MDNELQVAVMSNHEWLQLLFFGSFLFTVPLVIRGWLSGRVANSNVGVQSGVSTESYRMVTAAAAGQLHRSVVLPGDVGRPGRVLSSRTLQHYLPPGGATRPDIGGGD